MLQKLLHLLIVRPLTLLVIGLNVRHRQRLPAEGPAILVANHNSHLDTLVLMSLFPLRLLPRIRPVAAADYFLRNKLSAWASREIMRIIPITRAKASRDFLGPVTEALENGAIVILYPEGSRGRPEEMDELKSGIAHLARRCPEVPVTPLFLHGLGKSLPRGEGVLVPFFCDVIIGESLTWQGDRKEFMDALRQSFDALAAEGDFPAWD